MQDHTIVFDILKNEVMCLIHDHADKEVTAKTEYRNSGIYLLYVDSFDDTCIIPFYIGQTVDFQKRHKEHVTDVMEINRMDYKTYYSQFMYSSQFDGISSRYNGRFKACKIFKYMVEHGCSLKDLRMVILEECSPDKLEEREQQYFSRYLPAFFGFNQINTISESIKIRDIGAEKYQKYVLEDGYNLLKYSGYGYSKFNYLHGYPKNAYKSDSEEYVQLVLKLRSHYNVDEYYRKIGKMEKELSSICNLISETTIKLKPKAKKVFSGMIDAYFLENSLHRNDKKQNVIKYIVERDDYNYEWRETEKYINRYSRDKGEGLQKILNSPLVLEVCGDLFDLKATYQNKEQQLFEIKYAFAYDKFTDVFPNIEYDVCPLKDLFAPYDFPTVEGDDVCQIHIAYTRDMTNYQAMAHPEECLIEYRYINGDKVYKDTAFLQYYYSDITPGVEYKIGVNDYTYGLYEQTTIEKVFKKISRIINSNTTVLVYSSNRGWKEKLKITLNFVAIKNTWLCEKLKPICKKKH